MSGTDVFGHGTTPRPRGRSAATEAASGGRMRVKRWWAIRSSSMLIFAAVILCLFVIWNRDRNAVEQYLRFLDPVVKDLQARTTALGVVPAGIPDPKTGGKTVYAFEYKFGPEERQYAIRSADPVIIAYTPPVRRLLHRSGRCVIIHEKGRILAAWLTLGEFDERWAQQQQRLREFQAALRSSPVELP
jgi:hypothetical protein